MTNNIYGFIQDNATRLEEVTCFFHTSLNFAFCFFTNYVVVLHDGHDDLMWAS